VTLLQRIESHARADAPSSVVVLQGANDVINVVLAPKWWVEIVPAREDHRLAGAKWVLSKFGGIPKRPVAAVCEWDILVWLSEVWREA
jgi:hypothetical protein